MKNILLAALAASTLASAGTLTPAQKDTLCSMYNEEKVARDVYSTLYEQNEVRAFGKISESEQRHMDAVARQIQKYKVPCVLKTERGEFSDADTAALYTSLVDQGLEDRLAASKVGIAIELMDIKDLKAALADGPLPKSVRKTYKRLLRGSNKHLSAFRNLEDIFTPLESPF